jgi:hypothetical protein
MKYDYTDSICHRQYKTLKSYMIHTSSLNHRYKLLMRNIERLIENFTIENFELPK